MVSIIIVTFNAAATLRESIESVVRQTYADKELLIIDGLSSDGTMEIVRSFGNDIATVVSEKDNGIYDAMNKGIALAQGDWIFFLGADDLLFDSEVLTNVFSNRDLLNSKFIYGDTLLKFKNVNFGGRRTYAELIRKNINHQTIFYRKQLLEQYGGFDLKYKILADYDLNLRIFKNEAANPLYVPMNISLFNDRGGASNITIDSSFFTDKPFYFTQVDKMSPTDPALQQYNFYHGFVLLFRDKKLKGLSYCFKAFANGERKVFYLLVFVKFALGYFGVGKKIKIV